MADKLYTDFSIEVLEGRLETDPLLLSGLFSEIAPYCSCKKDGLCIVAYNVTALGTITGVVVSIHNG